ncbi:MAG: hypothetical protein R3A78_14435 [Polyangiales bacterium]
MLIRQLPLAFAIFASACGGSSEGGPAKTRLQDATLCATHNSYSGGTRGSIVAQLDGGIRFVELDAYWDADYFAVGHDGPGDMVELGGDNPASTELNAWVETLATWTKAHPRHAVITVGLDAKGDFEDAQVEELESIFRNAFGNALVEPEELGGEMPFVEDLNGRVIAVLSGNLSLRKRYKNDERLFFVEYQNGDPDDLKSLFWATSAFDFASVADWPAAGAVIRLWGVNDDFVLEPTHVTYAATDTPFVDWYKDYCESSDAFR